MKQSELNSALDLAYASVNGTQHIAAKEHKALVLKGLHELHEALDLSECVTPEKPEAPKMTEGSISQKAIAVQKIKDVIIMIDKCLEHIEEVALVEKLEETANTLEQYVAEVEIGKEEGSEIVEKTDLTEDELKKNEESETGLEAGLNEDESNPFV